MSYKQETSPFTLRDSFTRLGNTPFNRAVETTLDRLSGLHYLARRYDDLAPSFNEQDFLRRAFEALDVDYEFPEVELENIPAEGPAIVVANHPFGGIEGMVLADLLLRRRGDVRIMANGLLRRIPELRELFIAVDPFGGEGALQRNVRPMKEAVRWVENGGVLVVFPAGTVSHLHLSKRAITDPRWSDSIGRIVRRTGVPVVPAYFQGRNTWLFHAAGLVHPVLRTALLPRELVTKRGKTLRLRIGQSIDAKETEAFASPAALTEFLRGRTYALQVLQDNAATFFRLPRRRTKVVAPVVAKPDTAQLRGEVDALSPEQCLVESGEFQVFFARAQEIPWILQEIGRLREITFREVGEGTGKGVDLDLFDAYYLHLFVWNREQSQVVGAYRLGLADEVLARYGKKGLYTYSLFKYKRRLLEELNPALELGRSFIRKEYQRSFSPLLLLWKGIGQFVHRNPRYRVLFGPVSISSDYESLSQQLMVEFLKANSFVPGLAEMVKPRRPFRGPGPGWYQADFGYLRDIDGVSELVAKIERDAKGAPILLKQYLKLGGRLLGFNVDRHFNNAVDGLIMVDLAQTEIRVLSKYMGRLEAEQFVRLHNERQERMLEAS